MPVPVSGGSARDAARQRPQDRQRHLVDLEVVARGETQADRRPGAAESGGPGGIAGARPAHARLEDLADTISIEQERQTGDVVLVRMGQDDRVDPPVPRRDPLVEVDEQAVRVGTAIDQQATAARTLDAGSRRLGRRP